MSRWKIALRWLAGIVLLAVVYVAVGAAWAYCHDRSPSNFPMGEYVTPNEDFVTSQIIASAIGLSMVPRNTLIKANPPLATDEKGFQATNYRRDVHVKSHGCVFASFEVKDNLRDNLATGIFSKPGGYDAIIRFSSGQPKLNADSVTDARGFALKVMGVQGKKLLPGEEDALSQDFIMINSPVFFIRTIDEYVRFSKTLEHDAAKTQYFFAPMLEPWKWHAREVTLAQSTFKHMPDSLTTETYYSISAYKLGPRQYVKYIAKPCPDNKPLLHASPWYLSWFEKNDFDYLREELSKQAETGEACFDLMVQLQVPGKNMPVEDTTVAWSEKDSPFIPVAKITFKKGDNNTPEMNQSCENLSFNPWHSLPEHEPVGVMNRVRKSLYQSMGNFRRAKNCEQLCSTACSKGGPNGETCTPGCNNACMAKCPLLIDPRSAPPGLALPENACHAAAPAREDAEKLSLDLAPKSGSPVYPH